MLAILNVIWTPVNYFVRIASNEGMSAIAIAFCRWGTLAVILHLLLRLPAVRKITRAKWPTRSQGIQALCIGLFLLGPAHAFYYLALTGGTSTVVGTVLNTTSPIWTALLAFAFLRERAEPKRIVAMTIGFVGAWIVVIGFQLPNLHQGSTSGNLLYLLGTVCETLGGVLATRLVVKSSGITVLALEILGAAISLGLTALTVMPFSLGHAGLASLGALSYLILMSGLVCFGVWYVFLEKAPLSLMVISILLQSPLSAVLGYFALGEKITSDLVMGSVLILIALLVAASEKGTGAGRATA